MSEITKTLKELYPLQGNSIAKELAEYTKTLKRVEPSGNANWYKFLNLYFIYPDTIIRRTGSPLRHLIPHLEHIQDIGCNAVHILPFLDSPMVDAGFDVRDYTKVRKSLGNVNDLIAVKRKADKLNLKVFMDLVFNHVSDQHEWFKKAEAGDEKYRNYFIHTKEKPKFVKKFHKESAVWARYIVNGKEKDVNIAFPEYHGELPHWREGKDGYWYYHTYYPQQLDVNWRNPDVFIEFSKIVLYWAQYGFNFRLDAIPFVGKKAYKDVDKNNTFTHSITAAMNLLAQEVHPECAFIIETYEKLDTIVRYFGTSNIKTAQLGYNFHLCTKLWVSIVLQDVKYIWEVLPKMQEIPAYAEWINFLRNHDELSLAYLDDKTLKKVFDILIQNGEPFREGYGISGRTYSLLGHNQRRFLMAYFLLSSLPGGMLIPYGDQFAMRNIPMDKLSRYKQKDTRNINRGHLIQKLFISKKSKEISEAIGTIIRRRQVLCNYTNIPLKQLNSTDGLFAGSYNAGSSELIVLVNLTDKTKTFPLEKNGHVMVNQIGRIKIEEDKVKLGPYAGIWLQK